MTVNKIVCILPLLFLHAGRPCAGDVTSTPVQSLPPYDAVPFSAVSPDFKTVLLAYTSDAGSFLALNDRQIKLNAPILSAAFGSDGRYAYVFGTEKQKRIARNGGIDGPFSDVGDIIFSADGKHLAYAAQSDGKWSVNHDVAQKGYDSISTIQLSADGNVAAYVATRGDLDFCVWDRREGPKFPHARVAKPEFRNESERNASPDPLSNFASSITLPLLSSDGKHLAYMAAKDDKMLLVMDGRESMAYPEIVTAVMNATGQVACQARLETGDSAIIWNGKESNHYEEITAGPIFSADGKHLSFGAVKLGRDNSQTSYLVIDGVERVIDGPAVEIAFGSDARVGYVETVSLGPGPAPPRFRAVIDGTKSLNYRAVENLRLIPGGKHFSFIANNGAGQMFAVIDGTGCGPFDDILDVTFSSDQHHWAFAASKDKKWSIIIDGQALEGYEPVLNVVNGIAVQPSQDQYRAAYSFNDDDQLRCFMIKDKVLQRIVWKP